MQNQNAAKMSIKKREKENTQYLQTSGTKTRHNVCGVWGKQGNVRCHNRYMVRDCWRRWEEVKLKPREKKNLKKVGIGLGFFKRKKEKLKIEKPLVPDSSVPFLTLPTRATWMSLSLFFLN